MRTGDDRMRGPIATKRKVARARAETARPILTVRSFWERVDPLPDEK